MRAMAKYVDLEVLYASVDERDEAKPWNDACLVAHKEGMTSNKETRELENRMNNLEKKLDSSLATLNK